MISYDDIIVKLIALLPWCREQCVLALRLSHHLCSEKICVPSRAVVKTKMYRPVPSSNENTAPCRRNIFYLPSRPVVTISIHHPVPSWNKKIIVPYRPVPSRMFTATVLSRLIQATIFFIVIPSRYVSSSIVLPPNMSKQYRPVPSRIIPSMKALLFSFEYNIARMLTDSLMGFA